MKVRGIDSLGAYLREQRRNAELSLRQLADLTGVSNPYLSQIERGLRKPSAEVLQQLAKSLRISAEALYVRAGLLDPTDDDAANDDATEIAIRADVHLTERQKRVLLDIYASFRRENDERDEDGERPEDTGAADNTGRVAGGIGSVTESGAEREAASQGRSPATRDRGGESTGDTPATSGDDPVSVAGPAAVGTPSSVDDSAST